MDDLDSKMEAMRAHFEREADLESPWTSYNASLGRPLLNSAKFLASKVAPPVEDPSTADANTEPASATEEKAPTLPGFES
ncbi:MAG: phosphohydrolase, partial [Candidatus Sulfotelmatobacter sp.]